jgi:DNA-binding transcriptional regulator YhcF (GntR family)
MEREFKGVWIPKEVWLNKDLSLTEKALLAEIDSFSGEGKAFYKSNETIQEEYKVSRPTISKAFKKLEGLGFIKIEFDGRRRKVTYQADRKIFTGRRKEIYGQTVNNLPADRKNSTSINTTKEQVKEQVKEEAIVLPWTSETFSHIWEEWKEDRRERKIKKYTRRGELAALHKLHNETNGDEQQAIEAIQLAIANQWQGIFPRPKKASPKGPSRDEFNNYLKNGII